MRRPCRFCIRPVNGDNTELSDYQRAPPSEKNGGFHCRTEDPLETADHSHQRPAGEGKRGGMGVIETGYKLSLLTRHSWTDLVV